MNADVHNTDKNKDNTSESNTGEHKTQNENTDNDQGQKKKLSDIDLLMKSKKEMQKVKGTSLNYSEGATKRKPKANKEDETKSADLSAST